MKWKDEEDADRLPPRRKQRRSKIQRRRKFWFAACAMPDSGYADYLFFNQKFVDNAVRAKNNFADCLIIFFRHNSAQSRKLRQYLDFRDQEITERFCHAGLVLGDKQHDGFQVGARQLRPDYFESHVASCRLTSSCGIVSP